MTFTPYLYESLPQTAYVVLVSVTRHTTHNQFSVCRRRNTLRLCTEITKNKEQQTTRRQVHSEIVNWFYLLYEV